MSSSRGRAPSSRAARWLLRAAGQRGGRSPPLSCSRGRPHVVPSQGHGPGHSDLPSWGLLTPHSRSCGWADPVGLCALSMGALSAPRQPACGRTLSAHPPSVSPSPRPTPCPVIASPAAGGPGPAPPPLPPVPIPLGPQLAPPLPPPPPSPQRTDQVAPSLHHAQGPPPSLHHAQGPRPHTLSETLGPTGQAPETLNGR